MRKPNRFPLLHSSLISLSLLLLLLTCTSSCQKTGESEVPKSRPDLAELAHNLINQQRILNQKSALDWNAEVASSALQHSLNMAEGKVVFGHGGFTERIASLRNSLTFSNAGENIGYIKGYDSPIEEIVSRWMQNTEHRDNILGAFQLSGIGVASGPEGEIFITQIFLKTK